MPVGTKRVSEYFAYALMILVTIERVRPHINCLGLGFKNIIVVFSTGALFISLEKDLKSNQLQKTKVNCNIG